MSKLREETCIDMLWLIWKHHWRPR